MDSSSPRDVIGCLHTQTILHSRSSGRICWYSRRIEPLSTIIRSGEEVCSVRQKESASLTIDRRFDHSSAHTWIAVATSVFHTKKGKEVIELLFLKVQFDFHNLRLQMDRVNVGALNKSPSTGHTSRLIGWTVNSGIKSGPRSRWTVQDCLLLRSHFLLCPRGLLNICPRA